MKLAEILTKAYWHFFKFMPSEMILKRQWAEYDQSLENTQDMNLLKYILQ